MDSFCWKLWACKSSWKQTWDECTLKWFSWRKIIFLKERNALIIEKRFDILFNIMMCRQVKCFRELKDRYIWRVFFLAFIENRIVIEYFTTFRGTGFFGKFSLLDQCDGFFRLQIVCFFLYFSPLTFWTHFWWLDGF